MTLLEVAHTERNRLGRFCLLLSVASLIAVLWARDPQLNFSVPFMEGEIGCVALTEEEIEGESPLR